MPFRAKSFRGRPSGGACPPCPPTPPAVTQYGTVQELITASSALDAGYYEVSGIVLTYWDGTDFRDADGGNIIDVSPIMDHLSDVALWISRGNKVGSGAPVTTAATHWVARHPLTQRSVFGTSRTVSDIGGAQSITFAGAAWTTPDDALYDVTGPFEVFAVVQLSNNADTNKGIVGHFSGGGGWILGASDFNSPFGVWFGWGGTYVRASGRLGTDPHVVHGRYDGSNLYISVDGVDVGGPTAKTGTSAIATSLVLGGYDSNAMTHVNGKISESVIIKKSLTTQERADIVAHLMASVGI